jgi:hypothetical protein
MRTQILAACVAMVTLACSDARDPADPASLDASAGLDNAADAAARSYEITITNLTTGQPLSPGVIVTHDKQESLFATGTSASDGIRFIAENGDPSTAVTDLADASGIDDVVATMAPIHRIGGPGSTSLTSTVTARANANRLSLAIMLVCTNDGFAGLDAVELPHGFDPVTYDAWSYDAGTEVNDELSTDIPDGCTAIGPVTGAADGNGPVAENGIVQLHPGVQGGGFLDPMEHGWTDPVARVTIRRIR